MAATTNTPTLGDGNVFLTTIPAVTDVNANESDDEDVIMTDSTFEFKADAGPDVVVVTEMENPISNAERIRLNMVRAQVKAAERKAQTELARRALRSKAFAVLLNEDTHYSAVLQYLFPWDVIRFMSVDRSAWCIFEGFRTKSLFNQMSDIDCVATARAERLLSILNGTAGFDVESRARTDGVIRVHRFLDGHVEPALPFQGRVGSGGGLGGVSALDYWHRNLHVFKCFTNLRFRDGRHVLRLGYDLAYMWSRLRSAEDHNCIANTFTRMEQRSSGKFEDTDMVSLSDTVLDDVLSCAQTPFLFDILLRLVDHYSADLVQPASKLLSEKATMVIAFTAPLSQEHLMSALQNPCANAVEFARRFNLFEVDAPFDLPRYYASSSRFRERQQMVASNIELQNQITQRLSTRMDWKTHASNCESALSHCFQNPCNVTATEHILRTVPKDFVCRLRFSLSNLFLFDLRDLRALEGIVRETYDEKGSTIPWPAGPETVDELWKNALTRHASGLVFTVPHFLDYLEEKNISVDFGAVYLDHINQGISALLQIATDRNAGRFVHMEGIFTLVARLTNPDKFARDMTRHTCLMRIVDRVVLWAAFCTAQLAAQALEDLMRHRLARINLAGQSGHRWNDEVLQEPDFSEILGERHIQRVLGPAVIRMREMLVRGPPQVAEAFAKSLSGQERLVARDVAAKLQASKEARVAIAAQERAHENRLQECQGKLKEETYRSAAANAAAFDAETKFAIEKSMVDTLRATVAQKDAELEKLRLEMKSNNAAEKTTDATSTSSNSQPTLSDCFGKATSAKEVGNPKKKPAVSTRSKTKKPEPKNKKQKTGQQTSTSKATSESDSDSEESDEGSLLVTAKKRKKPSAQTQPLRPAAAPSPASTVS